MPAIDVARLQMENAEHPPAVDAWNSDWSAELAKQRPFVNRFCVECGQVRE